MQRQEKARSGERIRRVRREDLPALLDLVGGPPPGRLRALRRMTKTLTADVYVLERAAEVRGVVAVVYRRSFAHGGLTATIDAVHTLPEAPDQPRARDDTRALLACAVARAERRGCVAIDVAPATAEMQAALEADGFRPVASQLVRPLRPPATVAKGDA
jgi:hypothetical protein